MIFIIYLVYFSIFNRKIAKWIIDHFLVDLFNPKNLLVFLTPRNQMIVIINHEISNWLDLLFAFRYIQLLGLQFQHLQLILFIIRSDEIINSLVSIIIAILLTEPHLDPVVSNYTGCQYLFYHSS